ncbi:MAG TPA: T9SS type A sorting domain-containing protein [Ignavibacteriales bacterium]|nr:T9SS type A sorting domain-containing protein [Ignavibacteriales bacterium]
MKIRYLLVLLALLSASAFAQKVYPLKTIRDVQYRPDDSLKAGVNSAPLKDTVRIRALALHSTLRDPNMPFDSKNPTANQPFIFPGSSSAFVLYVQDSSKEWGGMQIYSRPQVDANGVDLTNISSADSAQYIEFTGYATEYNTVTEFMLIQKPTPVPINTLSQAANRPAAIELKISDFTSNDVMNPLAEKYENMYVIIRDVTVSDRNTSDGSFVINDSKGNKMYMYAQAGYNAIGKYLFSNYKGYVLPQNGAKLNYIRGIITDRWSSGTTPAGYYISPLYPNDISIGVQPPVISGIKRNSSLVAPNQAVNITASIVSLSGQSISGAKLFYRVNGSPYDSLDMTVTKDTTVFTATIPGIAKDSALVDFYIWAKDNLNQTATNPGGAGVGKSNYLYMVLKRPVTIKDVQYSPLGSGYGAYQGYRVTLTGVVTADTSDIPGNQGTYHELQRIFMQDGNGPWSGIWLFGTKALGVSKGDNVTVSGTIMENYSITRLDSITEVTVNSSNNNIPAPVELSTADIAAKTDGTVDAEQYEDMLVKYKDLAVVNDNADGPTYNDAEMLVADNSGIATRVKLGDGAHTYHNAWDNVVTTYPSWTQISKGNKFSSITGVLIFTDRNYKLIPRKNDDFQGYVSGVETVNNQPKSYSLEQNYPNPFNPSTTIAYSIPQDGMVSLKIYNLMGQEVKTLVNQFQTGGSYKASFDASRLPSGIYFYQLNSGSFTSVKKMLLLK